jgi:hypothetical protein
MILKFNEDFKPVNATRTHNKANALGQAKAPLVPHSAFSCR